jgi:hypothetical protein
MRYDRTVPYWFLAITMKLMRLNILVGAYEVRVGLVVCVWRHEVMKPQRLKVRSHFVRYIYVVKRFCMHSPAPIRLP